VLRREGSRARARPRHDNCRNVQELIHSKVRNLLGPDKVEKETYIYVNERIATNVTAPDYDEHMTELPLETREMKKRDELAADTDALMLPPCD
jgi:hypothetical protein